MPISVGVVTRVDEALMEAVARLLPQLAPGNPLPSRGEIESIVAAPCSAILVARAEADGSIVGMLTLVVYRIPTGLAAHIEDVVVDERARRHGVGEALARAALERARQAGAAHVDLTSRPAREAANRLYLRLGFEARTTNVYRYSFS
jgi:ribosomal protein S18 acetylase RimI-like enzyme